MKGEREGDLLVLHLGVGVQFFVIGLTEHFGRNLGYISIS